MRFALILFSTVFGQIFHNTSLIKVNFQVETLKASQNPVWIAQKPRKGDFREIKSQKIIRGSCLQASLEDKSCTFRAHCFRIGHHLSEIPA